MLPQGDKMIIDLNNPLRDKRTKEKYKLEELRKKNQTDQ